MPPAVPRIDGPLGHLAGMYFDPERNRYFPIPKDPPPPDPASTLPRSSPVHSSSRLPEEILPPTGCDIRWNKRAKLSHATSDAVPRAKTGRLVFRGKRAGDGDRSLRKYYSELDLQHTFSCGGCHGEQITSIKSFAGGAFYVTTDHGKVVIHRQDGETHGIAVCASGLVGMHTDISRMTMMAIAGGPEAHVHHFRRDPENLDYVFMQHSELDLPQGDIYSMSSFDDRCVLGGSKSLTTVSYTSGIKCTRRSLQSDVLAVHQSDPNLVFAGLRNGSVALEDLRVMSRQINRVGGTVKQKAVVGVRRLSDSAVPWGLVVSGLSDELLIYDIRFSSAPLHSCSGHINKYHDRLGLTTTPDDKFIYAAGSDNRLRLFDSRTGHRIMPELAAEEDSLHQRRIGPMEDNPLKRIFQDKIENIVVREDNLGVDLSVKGELMRFGAVDHAARGAYDELMSLD